MYIWLALVSHKDEFENARFDSEYQKHKRHKLSQMPSAREMLMLDDDDDDDDDERSFSAFNVSFSSSSSCLLRERIVFRSFTRSLGL